jgi:hypothetical protein
VAIIVGVPLFLARMRPAAAEHGRVSGDDLEITLIAVRPDAGDEFYDVAGEKIDGDPGLLWTGRETWQPDHQKRDFLFALPESGEEILFTRHQHLRPARTTRDLGGSGAAYHFRTGDGAGRFIVFRVFPRKYERTLFHFFRVSASIDEVDISVEYFHGPSLDGGYRFDGPFRFGATVQESSGLPGTLSAAAKAPSYAVPSVYFSVTSSRRDIVDLQPLAYDAGGRRHLGEFGNSRSSPTGARAEISFRDINLADIAAVAFERPRERTFHNIRVSYPDRPPRTRAPYLDKMAEALGKTGLSEEELRRISLESPEEALKVVDIVHGIHAFRAGETLRYSRVDFKGLDAETLERLRRAVEDWTASSDAKRCLAGIALGLKAGWSEYVPLLFDLLDEEEWETRRGAAGLFRRHSGLLDASHVERITQVLESTDDSDVCRELMMCLMNYRPAGRLAAIRRLSKGDKPWLWWPAVARLSERDLGDPEDWDDPTRARVALVRGRQWHPSLQSVTDAALADALVAVLTPDFCHMQYDPFRSALEKAAAVLDKDTMTRVMIDFIRSSLERDHWGGLPFDHHRNYHARGGICRAVRSLNALHGVDIAGLGSDLDAPAPDERGRDWEQNARDALHWYETGRMPGVLPEGYRATAGDLRVVWREKNDPEKGLVFLWSPSVEAPDAPRLHRLENGERFTVWRTRQSGDSPAWSFELEMGRIRDWATREALLLSKDDLPSIVFPNPSRKHVPWDDKTEPWEIHVERADSPDSVLSGTKVFDQWWEKYGPKNE